MFYKLYLLLQYHSYTLLLFVPKLSLHCYNRFSILISPHHSGVSDSYSKGGGMAVANAEFPRN